LESTFGGEHSLSFRSKPPKRKRNLRTDNGRQKKEENESSSDSESSTSNSMAIVKAAEPFKPQLDTFAKKNTLANSIAIEDFHIVGKLGEGSYSEVYRAVEKRSGFLCALKVL
jgi:hypothetical protein